ncbi:MAG: tetratricopeptide repeat protein, partial [Brevinema sp.]
MKKIIFSLLFSLTVLHAQNTTGFGTGSQWTSGSQNINGLGPEVFNPNEPSPRSIAIPTRSRSADSLPGTDVHVVPILDDTEPLPGSDFRSFTLYQNASRAFKNKEAGWEDKYRDFVRRFPSSVYTPYALYALASIETDYRRKVRFLLAIKEKFPTFPHISKVFDSLGDIYYLMDAPDTAKEVFMEGKTKYNSRYADYMLAIIALDARKPSEALGFIRNYIDSQPNPENGYKVYILYTEALMMQKRYADVITILAQTAPLRPWAYDNGLLLLLYTAQAYFNLGETKTLPTQVAERRADYNRSLYAFGLLRSRFSRSSEAKIAEQYFSALENRKATESLVIPWLADSFRTQIVPKPEVTFQPPVYGPGRTNVSLPGSITPPSTDFAYLPQMPLPTTTNRLSAQEFYVPARPARTEVQILTFTNRLSTTVTNLFTNVVTNRIFSMFTNTITNQFSSILQVLTTNNYTNLITAYVTNTNQEYEYIPIFITNHGTYLSTNTITNVIDVYITNAMAELGMRNITNFNPNYVTNYITNVRDIYVTNVATELSQRTNIIPVYFTNYVTNLIEDRISQQSTELVVRDATNIIASVYTNTITNYTTVTETNRIGELVLRTLTNTNLVPSTNFVTNIRTVTVTNTLQQVLPRIITNIQESLVTNARTNIYDVFITNAATALNYRTLTNTVAVPVTTTNLVIREATITNAVGEISLRSLTNAVLSTRTNYVTNVVDQYITNAATALNYRTLTNT